MRAELIYNQWFGKAVGFTSAFIFAPLDHTLLAVCIILAVSVGHLFDLWAARAGSRPLKVPAQAKARTSSESEAYHNYLFASLGHIAKQGGAVTPAHIETAQTLMSLMQLSIKQKTSAIAAFGAGKSPTFDFQGAAASLSRLNPSVASFTIRAFCETAAIAPRDAALDACVRLAGFLNIPPGTVAREFGAVLENEGQLKSSKTVRPSATYERPRAPTRRPRPIPSKTRNPALSAACERLGLSPESSAEAAKKAYRKLISKAHPDKLPPGASEARILAATREMIELREALDLVQSQQT